MPVLGLSPLGTIARSVGSYGINPDIIDSIDSAIGIGDDGATGGNDSTGSGPVPQRPPVPVDYSKTGIIYPLFGYPNSSWDAMLQYRNAHPSLPWIAIINPGNGPEDERAPSIAGYVDRMQASEITVLGYVSTFWGAVPAETVKLDIDRYGQFYDADGIFFDEMSNGLDDVEYYSEIAQYARAAGMERVVGNTGTDAAPAYIGVVDNIVISEGYGTPTLSRLGGWHVEHPRENFSYVAYSQNTIDAGFVATSSSFASYIYVTDDNFPNPYDELPSHFDELLEMLDPGTQNTLHNVVVKGVDLAGNPVNATLRISQGSQTLQAGTEWLTHVSDRGGTYEVRALDGNGYEFEHWEDGSASPRRTVQADSSSIILTAYYRSTGAPAEPGLTIAAMTGNGARTSMWTVIESGGQTVLTGFTPLRFAGVPGQEYTVYVSDWNYLSFDRWMDGSASNPYTFTYSGESYLAAYYDYDSSAVPHDTLTVNTYDEDGNIVTMWTVIREGETVVGEGYTPLTIQVERGKTYSVGVADWEDTVFDHWEDGSTERRTSITVDEPHERLAAYYTVQSRS
jgi:hypothetical protein